MKDFEFDVKKPIKVFTKVQQLYLKIIQKDSCLVESRSWQDRNLKFGPNCDLEVDNLEKK